MDRRAFGFWGLELDDDRFAQALALLGSLQSDYAPNEPNQSVLTDLAVEALNPSSEFVTFRFNHNIDWIFREAAGGYQAQQAPAKLFSDAWVAAVGQRGKPFRIELDPEEIPAGDLLWYIAELSRPAVGARSVYVRQDEPDFPVAWEWPLRIGLIPDTRSLKLLEELEKDSYQQLFQVIRLGTVWECDLLLLPYSLRPSVEAILKIGGRIAADCVLVMGGIKTEYFRAMNLLNLLRTEIHTAGVGVLFVPSGQRGTWFHKALAHISHNEPLDVALFSARGYSSSSPLLIGSRKLVEHANLKSTIKRMAKAIKVRGMEEKNIELLPELADRMRVSRGVQPVEKAARELEEAAEDFAFESESGDATAATEFRNEVEKQTEERIRIARANGSDDDQPTEDTVDRRRVQVQLNEKTDGGSERVETALRTSRSYELFVKIGLEEKGWADAPKFFPSHTLPPSSTGHHLKIIFYQLPRTGKDTEVQPTTAELYLPPDPSKSSTIAPFFFRTEESPYDFTGRIVIVYENRVLQTWRLTIPVVGSETQSEKLENWLHEETMVAGFSGLENRPAYDAALIVNDDEDGNLGLTAISKSQVSFHEPKGIEDSLKSIKETLSKLSEKFTDPLKLSDPHMLEVLTGFAHHGRLLLNALRREGIEIFSQAKRIQIVEAHQGAFLPVEFFYGRSAPKIDAPLCDHAEKGLLETPALLTCPHGDDDQVFCPTAFWGFNRVLERQPYVSQPMKDYLLTDTSTNPSLKRNSLALFSKAVFGVSSVVRKEDRREIGKILHKVTSGNAFGAQSWTDWVDLVQLHSPSLLVLVPHTQQGIPDRRFPVVPQGTASENTPVEPAVRFGGIAAMEISDDFLLTSQIEEKHVRKNEEKSPLVLLLGCNTKSTKVMFHNFVESFKEQKAAVIIGTLSIVRGRFTVEFLQQFFDALSAYRDVPGAGLGDVLLGVRQKLLAKGNPFVLSLMAYGDAEWQL